jgi:hypothetical protein
MVELVPHEEYAEEVSESRHAKHEYQMAMRYAVMRLSKMAHTPMRPEDQKHFAEDTIHGIKAILVLKARYGG